MENFLIKYGKLLTVISILLLAYLPFDVYRAISNMSPDHKYQSIGTLLNDVIFYLFVPIYLIVTIRNLNIKAKLENKDAVQGI